MSPHQSTSTSSFSFPYKFELAGKQKIPYPIVPVELETIRGKRIHFLIMDTGADYTTLPRYMIGLLGLQKSKLTRSSSQGVGKQPITTWETIIAININGQTLTVGCSFTDNDKTPPLLGKTGIFDKFNIYFDNDQNQVTFTFRQ